MPATTETKSVQGAVWTTAYVDSLPNSSFAYIDKSGGRHLPYKNADGKVDLPHARNALARLNQVKDMPADERDRVRAKLQSALKNAQAADDMVLRTTNAILADDISNAVDQELTRRSLDADGLPTRVHLLRAGDFNTQKYGEIPIQAGDLYEMKFNFDRGVGMAGDGQTGIPIDFAHQSHLEAAGWIHGLEVVTADDGGTELWGTGVEWSASGKTALVGKEYKCLSSDFYPAAFGEWVDPESGITAKNVIVGAALTNRPLFTGNTPVIASDGEAEATGIKTVIYVNATSETTKEQRMNLDQLRIKAAEDVTGAEQRFLQAHAAELSEDERKKFEIVVAAAAEEKKEDASVKAAEVQAAAELKAANDKIAELQASITPLQDALKASQKREAEAFVDEQVAQGKIVASEKDKWAERILADATTKELLAALPENKLLNATQGSSKNASEVSARELQTKKAQELMASEKGLSLEDALKRVAASDTELAQRVLDENRALAGVRAAA